MPSTAMEFKFPKGSRINKMIARDALEFQSGIAGGNATFLNVIFGRIRKQFFVDNARGVPYRNPPGGNVQNKRGRNRFVRGKFVNRTGQLVKNFSKINWQDQGIRSIGRNQSKDFRALVTPTRIVAEMSGRSGMILGIDKNKSKGKRQPFWKGFATVRNNWPKLVKFGIAQALGSRTKVVLEARRA